MKTIDTTKKKNAPTLGLCMIVKPTDEEAKLLDRLLQRVNLFFDKIYITITGENAECERVAKQFTHCEVSRFDWIKDFSAARNFNFSQAKTDYIMWLDCDDLVKNAQLLPKLMQKIGEDGRIIDAVVMEYLYDFDEHGVCVVKHLKTRIVKNDGCVRWVGVIHEDFEALRTLATDKNEEIQICHLPTEKHFEETTSRNTDIAKAELKRNPKDPRSWWLVANALLSEGKGEEALDYYYKFIELSHSEEEIFLVYYRIADIFRDLGDAERAFFAGLQALRLRPWYPDAYYNLAKTYYATGELRAAETMIRTGLTKPIPEDEIIVYNPREYDVNPLGLLAQIYMRLNRPLDAKECYERILKVYPNHRGSKETLANMNRKIKELKGVDDAVAKILVAKSKDEIKTILEALPDELRAHPKICAVRREHFVKTESSGKDIAFYCNYSVEEWTPETAMTKGIGGSEEAVINLSRELTKRGWNVEVYNNCGYKEQVFDGVKYRPFWTFNPKDRQDVLVVWRDAKVLDVDLNAGKIILDLHDAVQPGELNAIRLKKLFKVMVKSKAQRDLFPNVPDDKFAIIPNGVDISLFEQYEGKVERNPYHLVNFSSPDRSLETILDLIPEVYKRLPEEIARKTKFWWYYGWNVFDASTQDDQLAQEWKRKVLVKFEELKERGWIDGGTRLGHGELAKKSLEAGALIYPTEFYEIDYIGGSKAQVAGLVPMTTDFAALGDKIKFGYKLHSKKTIKDWNKDIHFNFGVSDPELKEKFIETVVDYLKNPHKWDEERNKMAAWAKAEFNWPHIAEQWHSLIS